MKKTEIEQLISFSDDILHDLRAFDARTKLKHGNIFLVIKTLRQALLDASDNIRADIYDVVPLFDRHQLLSFIKSTKSISSMITGEAYDTYGPWVILIKEILKKCLDKERENIDAASKFTNPDVNYLDASNQIINFGSDLLHPEIVKHCLRQFVSGDYRSCANNSVSTVCTIIRDRIGTDLDGKNLFDHAFGLKNARLVFSNLGTESGRNEQLGFKNLLEGYYSGVRNVISHSVKHEVDKKTAAQCMVSLSFLAYKIDACEVRSSAD